MAGLNALIQKIERLAAGEVKQRIASKVADACHAQCVLGFQQQRDPYGVPWKARKKPKAEWALRFGFIDDGHRILDDSGDMIDSLTARATNGRIVMRILGYARFHQTGTYKMVARKIFPDVSVGLGTWSQPIQDAALNAVRELMR